MYGILFGTRARAGKRTRRQREAEIEPMANVHFTFCKTMTLGPNLARLTFIKQQNMGNVAQSSFQQLDFDGSL